MVHKGFVNSFGPANGQDDRTDFLYAKSDYTALKRLVDGTEIAIFRDGNAAKDGLDVLIRRMETPQGVEMAAEMIPVYGAIHHVETRWSKQTEGNYSIRSYPDRFEVGALEGDKIRVLRVWYSQDGYKKENPNEKLDTKNTIREQTPQEPIVIKLR